MENKEKTNDKSRREFLSRFFPIAAKTNNLEMVKMLTADGKLVEVKKSIVDAATTRQKVSNKEILDWMQNPSKNNS